MIERYPENKFIDTNVFFYCFDEYDVEKAGKAGSIIQKIISGTGLFSTSLQVMGELSSVFQSKKRTENRYQDLLDLINNLKEIKSLLIYSYSIDTIKIAVVIAEKYGIHFWDSLIIATMLENNIFTIITENEKDFSKHPAITVVNPFK